MRLRRASSAARGPLNADVRQRMKCPECSKTIGFFSPALKGPAQERRCPHCQIPVRITLDFMTAAIFFGLFCVAAYFLLPILKSWGVPRAVLTVTSTVAMIALSMRLVRRSPQVR